MYRFFWKQNGRVKRWVKVCGLPPIGNMWHCSFILMIKNAATRADTYGAANSTATQAPQEPHSAAHCIKIHNLKLAHENIEMNTKRCKFRMTDRSSNENSSIFGDWEQINVHIFLKKKMPKRQKHKSKQVKPALRVLPTINPSFSSSWVFLWWSFDIHAAAWLSEAGTLPWTAREDHLLYFHFLTWSEPWVRQQDRVGVFTGGASPPPQTETPLNVWNVLSGESSSIFIRLTSQPPPLVRYVL